MSFGGSLSRSSGGLSFAFVTGFGAKTQAPPLLLGLRASLYRPNQRETIAMGDCYILCGWSGVPGPLGRLIVSDVISCAGGQVFLVRLGGSSSAMRAVHVAAGCSVKEGSTISVSFWLRMPLARGCWLSVTERSVLRPVSLVRACFRSVSSL